MSESTSAPADRGSLDLFARAAQIHPKYFVSFFITLVLVLGEWRYAILGGYDRLAIALATCVGMELLFSKLLRGQFANVQSAYITGVSLSLLLKPQSGLMWPFVLGGFLAISSKYALTYRQRHLWNPSNFAIAVLLLVAPGKVAILSHQFGSELATNAIIWTFGLMIAARARVLHVTLTYVASFIVLAGLRNLIVGGPVLAEIAPLTGPMYQLFVFFMITDPRTTVASKRGRIIVAATVAFVEALIRIGGDMQWGVLAPLYVSPPILALAIVGPVAMIVNQRKVS